MYLEWKYGKTCSVPGFDEESGVCGVKSPDADCPVVDPVHMTDGGLTGNSIHDNPNVV